LEKEKTRILSAKSASNANKPFVVFNNIALLWYGRVPIAPLKYNNTGTCTGASVVK